MTDPVLRPMRWWDIERLLPLERELFGDEAWSPGMFWSELAQRETRCYLVAEDGSGAPQGYAGVCVYPAESYVQTIAVVPAAQRAGLGSRLLTALLEEVAGRGESTVLLEVRADNERAQSMYRRFGFLPVGLRRGYYQPSGTDAVVMQLHDVEGHLAALREAAAR
ncbi:MAG: ribosomal protein S18-alanine N-acetyltransferase [Frankiaceae bacterium]